MLQVYRDVAVFLFRACAAEGESWRVHANFVIIHQRNDAENENYQRMARDKALRYRTVFLGRIWNFPFFNELPPRTQ